MAKQRNTTRGLCVLLALVLCAGLLAALPMRAQAAGDNYEAYGAGGGGGGGGGAFPPIGGMGGGGGKGGDSGLGPGDSGQGVGTPATTGGRGGDGALGGELLNGIQLATALPGSGGNGGTGGSDSPPPGSGGPGLAGLAFDRAPAPGGYGSITVRGGDGGDAGGDGTGSLYGGGGPGGDGGPVNVTFDAGDVTADSVTVQGGGGGEAAGGFGIPGGGGGNAALMVVGTLTANSLSVAGGTPPQGSPNPGGRASLATNGGDIILSGRAQASNEGQLSSSAGLIVPEGAQSTLELTDFGRFAAGYLQVGAGASLTLNGDGTSIFSAGRIDMSPGATLVVNGVDLGTIPINSSLDSTYYNYGKYTGGSLVVGVSVDPNPLRGVWVNDAPLADGTDYTWDGTTRQLALTESFLRGLAIGTHDLKVGMGPDGQPPLTAPLNIFSGEPMLQIDMQGGATVDVSLDGGATWAPYTQGQGVPLASATSIMLNARYTAPFVGVMTALGGARLDDVRVVDHRYSAVLVPDSGSAFTGRVNVTLGAQPITTRHDDLATAFEADGSLVVRSNVEPAGYELLGWTVDVNTWLVGGTDYTDMATGQFAIRLNKSFLDTLAPGTHTVQLMLFDGQAWSYAQGSFAWPLPAPTPAPAPAVVPAAAGTAAAPSPQTGDIGTGPYIVFAVSGGLMIIWLGMQVFKRRGKDD